MTFKPLFYFILKQAYSLEKAESNMAPYFCQANKISSKDPNIAQEYEVGLDLRSGVGEGLLGYVQQKKHFPQRL